jgi:hypothetical protein
MKDINKIPDNLVMRWVPEDTKGIVPRVFVVGKDPSAVTPDNPDGYVENPCWERLDLDTLKGLRNKAAKESLKLAPTFATAGFLGVGALMLATGGVAGFALASTWAFMAGCGLATATAPLVDAASKRMTDLSLITSEYNYPRYH